MGPQERVIDMASGLTKVLVVSFIGAASLSSAAFAQNDGSAYFRTQWGDSVQQVLAQRNLDEAAFSRGLIREQVSLRPLDLPATVAFGFARGPLLSGAINDVGGLESISLEAQLDGSPCILLADQYIDIFSSRGANFQETFYSGLTTISAQRVAYLENGTRVSVGYLIQEPQCELTLRLDSPQEDSADMDIERRIIYQR